MADGREGQGDSGHGCCDALSRRPKTSGPDATEGGDSGALPVGGAGSAGRSCRWWQNGSRPRRSWRRSIPRVVVSEAVNARRYADSAARKLDGRFRRDREAGRSPDSSASWTPAAAAPRGSIWPTGWCRPSNPLTARVYREPHLAPILRHRAFPRCWTISARRANGQRIRNCSTGWRPNSCSPRSRRQGAHAWDMKHLIRTIVTSHTYRQSSLSTAGTGRTDPDNRLLARQSRFRVDAEVVRDIALVGLRPAGGEVRRPQRQAVSARWLPGRAEFPQARVFGQPRRRSVSPRGLYASGSGLSCIPACSLSTRPRARSARSIA